MANLKDIRKRITSVKNTRQITKAMKMVAASKLRRAQEAIVGARPYAYRIYSILLTLAEGATGSHPLLEVRPEKKIRVVVLAGERGLCGSFNTNVLKAAHRFINLKEQEGVEVTVECIGRKANDYFKRRREVAFYHEGLLGRATYGNAGKVAEKIIEEYSQGDLDAVYLVYNEFKSAIQQKVMVEKLIPISTEPPQGVLNLMRKNAEVQNTDYVFEPSKPEILTELVTRHFKMQIFRAVLESLASEHGSRMSAMESATQNASEMIEGLTLQYNKARQASITKELMEIVGGVEAMR
jgi:F-type H+-transporting ATPase subunit gamma